LRQQFGQPSAIRGEERSRPAVPRELHNARPESRGTMPQTRLQSTTPQTRLQSTTPQTRPQSMTPQPRSERSAPQVRDRLPDRTARAEVGHLQLRAPESRPAAAAPRASPTPRALTQPPVVLAHPPTAHPRAAASAPLHAPRITGNHASGGARAYGGGPPRAMSSGRGGGRS
jgi:hypothetical protein